MLTLLITKLKKNQYVIRFLSQPVKIEMKTKVK